MSEEMENILNAASPVEGKPTLDLSDIEDKMEEPIPDMSDPSWSDYVLNQLTEEEKYNGNPTTDGLRRIVVKLLGPIVRSMPIIAQCPNRDNGNHATIGWEIAIKYQDNPMDIRTFGDVADVYSENTDALFAKHPSATASTKAEGRALRKALQLRHTLAAEEISNISVSESTNITTSQISWINLTCDKNNIDVNKLLQQSKTKKYERLEDVPYTVALQIIKYLNACQNGEKKITDNIRSM